MDLTIIVLTKNNFEELESTLKSIENHCNGINILIVDGSKNRIMDNKLFINKFNNYIYKYEPKIEGIYPSMNFAIKFVKSNYLMFLNSGDSLLKSPMKAITKLKNSNNICSFSSTMILNKSSKKLYISPSPKIKRFSIWFFLGQLPIHQSMIISTKWSKKNLYPINCKIASDNIIKRKIINSKKFLYNKEILVSFSIGGLSSSLSLKTLFLYLRSKQISIIRKIVLILRYMVGNLFGYRFLALRIKLINLIVSL
jgi:hypothetical protein